MQNPDAALWRQQMRLGSRAYVACLASFVVSRLPLYLVGSRGGMAETAYFTQALVIADTMLVVPNALGMVLFPNMAAARDPRERIRATLRLAAITLGLMAIAVIAAMILGPIVLPLVYGKAYAASMPVLLAMLTGVAALGLCSVMQNALSANGYPWASVASPIAGVAAVAIGLSVSSTAIGCGWAYSLGGVVMLVTSAIAWWLHRNDWAEIQETVADVPPTSTA
jgi:O-antigen/teichoic acid export membrane protein